MFSPEERRRGLDVKRRGSFLETGTDELERSESAEGLEAFGEVVGVEEGGEMILELGVAVVVVGLDSGNP